MASASGWHRKRLGTPAELERKKKYNSAEHKRARQRLARTVDAGTATCWRCGRWIPPGIAWHVGHDDYDVNIIRGAEHDRCNLTAAASKGARTRNGVAAARRASRNW